MIRVIDFSFFNSWIVVYNIKYNQVFQIHINYMILAKEWVMSNFRSEQYHLAFQLQGFSVNDLRAKLFVTDAPMKIKFNILVLPPLTALWNMGLKTAHGWVG